MQTTPYLIVHTTISLSILTTVASVQGLSDHVDHCVATASEHDLLLRRSSVTLLLGSSSDFLVEGKSFKMYI